ncbi:MAG TPA: DPP IV N-terminal domain-containing protein [Puia sp.]|nr:DPP IV N-terminal domain-containing protein [Puia sp.]
MLPFRHIRLLLFLLIVTGVCQAQPGSTLLKWTPDGNAFFRAGSGTIVRVAATGQETVVVPPELLTPAGHGRALAIRDFSFSKDGSKLLIYTNARRVWRYDTRGDYWVLDRTTRQLEQIGRDRPVSSLQFAKLSPDGSKVAFSSGHNLYVEDLATGVDKCLTTTDSTRKLINGTFDWAYEEELECRDGFRWSPDGRHIAYWQIDARRVKDYLMLNTTDSAYPFVKPVEYPIAGEPPSPYRIGVVDVTTGANRWMDIPGDPGNSYLPRMEWADNSSELILQQLNRRQNESKLFLSDIATGHTTPLYDEKDSAFIECKGAWQDGVIAGWDWLKGGGEFLWVSEKDGWRHIYRVSRDGKRETLVTKGNYDVIQVSLIDEKGGYVYFIASPGNATQKYLYRTRLDGKGPLQRLTPADEPGIHQYDISPTGRLALHTWSNANMPEKQELVSLPEHASLSRARAAEAPEPIRSAGTAGPAEAPGPAGAPASAEAPGPIRSAEETPSEKVEFFRITTADGVQMDGWMVRPVPFDSTKKYPVVFYVYGEPAAQTVLDEYGTGDNPLYEGDMAKDGYLYVSIDNRGTPAPRGSAWRKSIYRRIGRLNIRDQAMAAKEVLKWPFVDTGRVAVWGWSGGGSSTLNLLFQYPGIYKTGIAIAAVGDQRSYDNLYQERYMGLPQENPGDFEAGSPITYAGNLQGHLLYVHGTGDDNVHYQNAERLLNALIRYDKLFQFMAYPNRSHSIDEGEGTRRHLAHLYTDFLRRNCPPGGR